MDRRMRIALLLGLALVVWLLARESVPERTAAPEAAPVARPAETAHARAPLLTVGPVAAPSSRRVTAAEDVAGDAPPPAKPSAGFRPYVVHGVVKVAGIGLRHPEPDILAWPQQDALLGQPLLRVVPDGPSGFFIRVRWSGDAPSSYAIRNPGWRLVRWHRAEDEARISIDHATEQRTRYDIVLWVEPVFALSGEVVDARGAGVAAAELTCSVPASGAWHQLRAGTDASGRFEIGPFPEDPRHSLRPGLDPARIRQVPIRIRRAGYASGRLLPYAVPAGERAAVRLVLAPGLRIAGRLEDEAGDALAGIVIEVRHEADPDLRGTTTDAEGRWAVGDVPPGALTLVARAFEADALARHALVLDRDRDDVRLVARPIRLGASPRIADVLGLELVDVTDELRRAFVLSAHDQVMVWKAPRSSFWHSSLRRGATIRYLGDKRVQGVIDVIDGLLGLLDGPPAQGGLAVAESIRFQTWDEGGQRTLADGLTLHPEARAQLTALREHWQGSAADR